MNRLKKYYAQILMCFTLVLLSSCSTEDMADPDIMAEKLSITSFKMLSNNHSFSVISSHTQPVDSLVICLFPSAVDYSSITPSIAFEGDRIEYRVNGSDFMAYNGEGDTIDFSYPNTVDFKITNSDDSEYKIYRIIVDTEQPILFNNNEITIPDTQVNTSYAGLDIDTWTNVGNYPIRLTLRTTEYVDVNTPEEGINNIFSATLTNAADMIKPNETASVNVFAGASVVGEYEATALFSLYFNENLGYLVYDDVDNDYVKNIGYQKGELKLKGKMIN